VRSLKKFNVHLCQKVPFVLACFQAELAPQPENSDSKEKDTLFGLDIQMTIYIPCELYKIIFYLLSLPLLLLND
jgi:hypothetical protein